ncbi:hypothetical protein AAG570_005684 [Ranatra chinensis]|uniref:Odorant receptor n=1 Tax=Ranatra chinensis TaxID=642074 RepID=A0ABD0YJW6_9HEMI
MWAMLSSKRGLVGMLVDLMARSLFLGHVTYQIVDTLHAGYPFSLLTEKLAVNLTMLESAIKMAYYHYKWRSLRALTRGILFSRCFLKDLLVGGVMARDVLAKGSTAANRAVGWFLGILFFTVMVWNSVPPVRCSWMGSCLDWRILPTHYPFDVDSLPAGVLVYLYEFGLMVYCAHLLANVNCLFAAFAICLSAQFDVLTANLTRLRPGYAAPRTMETLLRSCLEDHQTLLKSESVRWALYSCGWPVESVWFKKCILVAMVRASKAEGLTAGKFYTINLVAFAQVILFIYLISFKSIIKDINPLFDGLVSRNVYLKKFFEEIPSSQNT